MSKRQTYTKEFILEAVRLLEQNNQTAAELAMQLGVSRVGDESIAKKEYLAQKGSV